jgi:hypothetical protein
VGISWGVSGGCTPRKWPSHVVGEDIWGGHRCAAVCCDNDRSLFHWCCIKDGGSTGVSRPGGQGRGEVAPEEKPWEQQSLGGQVPGKEASRRIAFVVKLQELSKMYRLGWGITWGVPRGCSQWNWPSPVGGKASRGQSRFSCGLHYLTWDGRCPGVPKRAKTRPRGQCHWGQSQRAKHQSEAAQKGQRPTGTNGGPACHGRSPEKARNGFPKPWWARHRIESPGAEFQEQEV